MMTTVVMTRGLGGTELTRRSAHLRGRWAAAAGIAVGTLLLGPVSPVTPAQAYSGYGRVVHIDDGDTVDVDLESGGVVRVRFIAIQAMELTEYHHEVNGQVSPQIRGYCHGPSATRRLHSLVYGKRVRLSARFASSRKGSRLARFVAVQQGGRWVDVGGIMIAEGYTLLSVNPVEYGRNREYRVLAQQAARTGAHLWNTDACGSGPSQSARIRVGVRWDAAGDDGRNVNGEWIRISSSRSVSLARWWVRDAAMRGNHGLLYRLPTGARVSPSRPVYVHVGKGRAHTTSKARHYYMGQSAPIFENVTKAPTYLGDGGYLFDPDGDLRAWQQYPCAYRC